MSERNPPAGRIYLRHEDGLIPMRETPYDAEELLQRLIADYPDLLAGDQMDPVDPRRWLLVDREVGIEDAPEGAGRWSLDHLFVDHGGIPTLIEVKRSSDTRIRREVAGQMLDYAANLSRHWPADEVRQRFEERCRREGLDPVVETCGLLAPGADPGVVPAESIERFWDGVADNLRTKRLRLLFVADVIPTELQAIIEFLNEGLARIEVLGVEVKQYVGEGRQTIVPRVIGRTISAEEAKGRAPGPRTRREWTPDDLRAAAYGTSPEAGRLLDTALAWLSRNGLPLEIGSGASGPLYLPAIDGDGATVRVASLATTGRLELLFPDLKTRSPYEDPEARAELLERYESALGVPLPAESARAGTWTSIGLAELGDPAPLTRLIVEIDRVTAHLSGSHR